MKKIYLLVIVIIAGATLFLSLNKTDLETPALLETQTNSEGSVTVKITPRISSEIAFEVILDTHSEELNYDLTQAVTLKDETGQEYKPISWEGDPPEGHHRGGWLNFGPLAAVPKTLQLTVRQIGDAPERRFLWTTKS